jgi:hypothetical protein
MQKALTHSQQRNEFTIVREIQAVVTDSAEFIRSVPVYIFDA